MTLTVDFATNNTPSLYGNFCHAKVFQFQHDCVWSPGLKGQLQGTVRLNCEYHSAWKGRKQKCELHLCRKNIGRGEAANTFKILEK